MSQQFNAVTVQSSGATSILTANNARRGFIVKNNGSVTVYVGMDSTVTTSSGVLLLPQDSWSVNGDRCYRGAIFGIAASATADVRFWEWEA